MTERAQAFTLEAFVASLVLLASVVYALNVVGVTGSTASTSSDDVERQLEQTADGILDAAAANRSLRPTLLYWNASGGRFHDAAGTHYVADRPPTRFAALLDRTLGKPDRVYNVNVHYVTPGGNTRSQRLISHGTPSDHAVRVTEPVTLYDEDTLYSDAVEPTNSTLADTPGFYAPDAAPRSPVYNLVHVEVVVWYV